MFSASYSSFDGHHHQKPGGDLHSSASSSGSYSNDFNPSFLDGSSTAAVSSSHHWSSSHRTPFAAFEGGGSGGGGGAAHFKLDPDQVQVHPPLSQSQPGSSSLPLPPISADGNWNYLSSSSNNSNNNDALYSRYNTHNGNNPANSNAPGPSSSTDSLHQHRTSEPQVFKRGSGSQPFGNVSSNGAVQPYYGDMRLSSSHSTASSVSSASSYSDYHGANFPQGEFESPFGHHHPDDMTGSGAGVMYSEPLNLSAEGLNLQNGTNSSQTHLGHYSDAEQSSQQQPHAHFSQGYHHHPHHHHHHHPPSSFPPIHGGVTGTTDLGSNSTDHLPLSHSQTSSPMVVPTQTAPLPTTVAYSSRPSSSSGVGGGGGGGVAIGSTTIGGIQIMHTDDASSKETQFLRRRCHNCHTTEPPSWRRSTLNEGKIVCNKCGLYERTHMRPRPPRFDEVRTTNSKSRKGSKGSSISMNGIGSTARLKKDRASSSIPNAALARVGEMQSRRGSNSSNASGNSDWDETLPTFQSQQRQQQQHHGSSSLSGSDFPFGGLGSHTSVGQQAQFSPPPGSHFGLGTSAGTGTGTGGYGHPYGGHSHPIHSASLDSASPIRLPRTPALSTSFSNETSSLGVEDQRVLRKSATSPAPLSLHHSPSPSILSNMGTYGSYPSTPDLSAGLGSIGLGNGAGPQPEFGTATAGGSDVSGRKSRASSRASSSASVQNSPFMNAGILQQRQQHATPPLSSSTIQQGDGTGGGDRAQGLPFSTSSSWRPFVEQYSVHNHVGSSPATPPIGSNHHNHSIANGKGQSVPPSGAAPVQGQAVAQVQGVESSG